MKEGWEGDMTLIVDINHLLDEGGDLPIDKTRLLPPALRVARFIEYGGPLNQLEGRETLIPCRRRPERKRCPGFIWVVKQNDNRIQAHCPICHEVEAVISGWEGTDWAEGPMEPEPM